MTRIVDNAGPDIIIEDRPIVLGLCLIAAILAAVAMLFQAWDEASIGLAFAACLLGGGSALWLNRGIRHVRLTLPASGDATLWIRSTGGTTVRKIRRDTLRAAIQSDRRDNGVTTRLMLLIDTPDGVERLPFTGYYSGGSALEPIVAQIMDWRRA